MASAAAIRLQIESALARKIPSALTPAPRILRPVATTGIEALDEFLQGGLPIGAITELVGGECSGRTSAALSFVAQRTSAAKVCAWIDVSDALDPISAAAAGVDLSRLLWVRCPAQLLRRGKQGTSQPSFRPRPSAPLSQTWPSAARRPAERAPWGSLERALRVTDLLLQAGGFSAIVLDMGSLEPEFVSRVPLATWFRYRAAAERAQCSILLIAQHACAKSSAELLMHFQPGEALCEEATVFTGIHNRVEARRRFAQTEEKAVPLRKPPQRVNRASWQSRTAWAGPR